MYALVFDRYQTQSGDFSGDGASFDVQYSVQSTTRYFTLLEDIPVM